MYLTSGSCLAVLALSAPAFAEVELREVGGSPPLVAALERVSLPDARARPDLDDVAAARGISGAFGLTPRGGQDSSATLRALGPTYKADFGPGGLVFTPAMGSAVERSQPVYLGFEAMGRGGVEQLRFGGSHRPSDAAVAGGLRP